MTDGFVHHVSGLAFRNSTRLDSSQLMKMFSDAMADWRVDSLSVWVRYGRGADFSGSCYDREGRILVNLGRGVVFPYLMATDVARSFRRNSERYKPVYTIELLNAYQLALFVFLHECYHWLVYKADRNTRQKESMCDRFAARYLVDQFGCPVRCEGGELVMRAAWDYQDLDGFVVAMRRPGSESRQPHRLPKKRAPQGCEIGAQLLLFCD